MSHFSNDDDEPARKTDGTPYSPHYKANNEGGHGNPPVKSQFKHGGAGGPGRPKGPRSVEAQLRKIFNEPLPVKTSEGKKMVDPTRAMVERLFSLVLGPKATLTSLQFGLELAAQFGPQAGNNIDPRAVVASLKPTERNLFYEIIIFALGQKSKYPQRCRETGQVIDPLPGYYKITRKEDRTLGTEKMNEEEVCPSCGRINPEGMPEPELG